ncbi:MAG TPA: tRNA (adenosine(37)-N6)-threonylcarbamoyltransferase complex transferase subunit TsaD [Candidatus Paceibacterota bacterium]
MKILAIETSCDETAVAIIKYNNNLHKSASFKVLANLVSSQVKLHEKFGGVVPNLARREHEKNLVPILIKTLKEANLYQIKNNESGIRNETKLHNSLFTITSLILEREKVLREKFLKYILPLKIPALDMVAVTYGPGLAPALWTGVNFAKALSVLWNIPLRPINHMEGHIFSSLIKQRKDTNDYSLTTIRYPAIALLVSGGHTELHLIKKLGSYKRIGETLDDAAGEAFDKVAKMLGLGYPGGPEISKQAEKGNPRAISFPRPMLKANNFNFSFSGLKTSVLYYLRDNPKYHIPDVAASFEQAIIDVLVEKTVRATQKYQAKTILIGGGVAANKKLRAELEKKIDKDTPGAFFLTPPITHTGDNALMIALAAVYGKQSRAAFSRQRKTAKKIGAIPNLKL